MISGTLVHDATTNNPPSLAEELAEETQADAEQAAKLVAATAKSHIVDAGTQSQATVLANLLRAHFKAVDGRRDARKRPFDNDSKVVQAAFKAILDPMDTAIEILRKMNDAWEDKQEAMRQAERDRIAAEERRQREEVEALERRAREAEEAGSSDIGAQLAAIKANEDADALARRREAVRPEMVRTDVGTSSRAMVREFVIDDPRKLLSYLLRANKAELITLLQPMVDRLGRARVAMPGVTVKEVPKTRFR
jgi:hypothetical protein